MILFLAFAPIVAAVPVYFIGRKNEKARNALLLALYLLILLCAVGLLIRTRSGDVTLSLAHLFGGLSFRADGFRALYVIVASVMWLVSFLFSGEYFAHLTHRDRYFLFTLFTTTGTTGLFLSDDLTTTFIFFEIMSLSSYAWVAHDEKPSSLSAGRTYLALSVFGGMVTLMGMMLLWKQVGSLSFAALATAPRTAAVNTAAGLTLVGFATKAGVFPLHVWLPKAHPVAPAPASALLSGILTKTGVFGLLVVSTRLFSGSVAWGTVLMLFGLVTLLAGAILALFSRNLKRTLACSSMSQIGYILTGIGAAVILGEEGSLALTGVISHMVNHSMFKLLLFGCAGVIYMNAHTLDLDELRGFGRGKPYLRAAFLIGAIGIACIPGLSGYIGKTMIHEGIVECASLSGFYRVAEWLFLIGAGITTTYMLKLYIILFVDRNPVQSVARHYEEKNGRYARLPSLIGLAIPAVFIVLCGVLPYLTLLPLAEGSLSFVLAGSPHLPRFFSSETILSGLISPAIGIFLYIFVVRTFLKDKKGCAIDPFAGKKSLEDAVWTSSLFRTAGKAFNALATALDSILSPRVLHVAGDILTFPLRLFDELSDEGVLLLRALFFRNHHEGAVRPESVFTRESDTIYRDARRVVKKLPKMHHRDAEDMTYGSKLTNTISFGLLIGLIGILFALICVLIANR